MTLGIAMPVLNGIDAARLLKVKYPQVKVVFITMQADRTYVRAAFEADASVHQLNRWTANNGTGHARHAKRQFPYHPRGDQGPGRKHIVGHPLRRIRDPLARGAQLAEGQAVDDIGGTEESSRRVEVTKGNSWGTQPAHNHRICQRSLAQGLMANRRDSLAAVGSSPIDLLY
ncbi:MAG: hypothetical protein M3M98_08015 [Nitrospirota bacterium]|nr:hypothetical protein [Nitrospirota bacterium]